MRRKDHASVGIASTQVWSRKRSSFHKPVMVLQVAAVSVKEHRETTAAANLYDSLASARL